MTVSGQKFVFKTTQKQNPKPSNYFLLRCTTSCKSGAALQRSASGKKHDVRSKLHFRHIHRSFDLLNVMICIQVSSFFAPESSSPPRQDELAGNRTSGSRPSDPPGMSALHLLNGSLRHFVVIALYMLVSWLSHDDAVVNVCLVHALFTV